MIKEARQKAGFTLAEASRLLSVPRRTLEDWESKKRFPKKGEQYYAERLAALGILTKDGIQSYIEGEWDIEDILFMYKRRQAEKLSKWGAFCETFQRNWERIPKSLYDTLTAEQLADLVDAIKGAYDAGVSFGRNNKDC